MKLQWVAALVLAQLCSSVAGLRSSGNEFYIPFWFDSPNNEADATVLYLSTFEITPITVDMVIHVQNYSSVHKIYHTVSVFPDNFTVISIKELLPSNLDSAKERVPNHDPSWWLIDYLQIKARNDKEIMMHVLNRILHNLFIYTPFSHSHYKEEQNVSLKYYIIQDPEVRDDSSTPNMPAVVLLTVFNDTHIRIKPNVYSRVQFGLVGEGIPYDDYAFPVSENQNRLYNLTHGPSLVIFTPDLHYSSQLIPSYNQMEIVADKPIFVFVGRGVLTTHSYMTYQQIPPTTEWGKDFVSFRIGKRTPGSEFYAAFRLISSDYGRAFYRIFTQSGTRNMGLRILNEISPGTLLNSFDSYKIKDYVLSSNSTMWANEAYHRENKHVFSYIPSVDHYGNIYKFPAGGPGTDFMTVEIKLVVPAKFYQPEQIILDGTSVTELGMNFRELKFNDSLKYYAAEYTVDDNCSTNLSNDSNAHWIYHNDTDAQFGLLITGHMCTLDSVFAFPVGFDGNIHDPPHIYYNDKPTAATSENTQMTKSASDDNTATKTAATTVAILLGILAVSIAGVLVLRSALKKFKKKKNVSWQRLVSMEGILEMKEPDPTNCEYDVFISFADENHNFVEQHIYQPLEEQGFKVCWHHRDFAPGYSIIENIKNSIDKSRRVILVFSEHFHKSEYCLFELRYSCERMLATHSQMVIPIVLHEDSFPRELDHITYWKFSVENPEENNLQSLIERLGTRISESQEVVPQVEETAFDDKSDIFYNIML